MLHSIPRPPGLMDKKHAKQSLRSYRCLSPPGRGSPPPQDFFLGKDLAEGPLGKNRYEEPHHHLLPEARCEEVKLYGVAIAMSGAACGKNSLGLTRSVTPFVMGCVGPDS